MKDDAYGKLTFGLIAILVLFMFPTIFMGLQMQRSAETRANEYTEQFVDNCRSTGFITYHDYQAYMDKMSLLGLSWDVQMFHYSVSYTRDAHDKLVATDTVKTKEDIATVIGNATGNGRYTMKKGDKFEIIATSKSEIMGASFVHIFDKGQQQKIYIQCAEMIDNNPDIY